MILFLSNKSINGQTGIRLRQNIDQIAKKIVEISKKYFTHFGFTPKLYQFLNYYTDIS